MDVQVIPSGSNLKPPDDRSLNLGLNPNLEKEMELLETLFQMNSNDDNNSDTGSWE